MHDHNTIPIKIQQPLNGTIKMAKIIKMGPATCATCAGDDFKTYTA